MNRRLLRSVIHYEKNSVYTCERWLICQAAHSWLARTHLSQCSRESLALLLRELQEPQFQGSDHRLGTVGNPQLADYMLDMILGRA
jgi:hypothetical protein